LRSCIDLPDLVSLWPEHFPDLVSLLPKHFLGLVSLCPKHFPDLVSRLPQETHKIRKVNATATRLWEGSDATRLLEGVQKGVQLGIQKRSLFGFSLDTECKLHELHS